VASMSAYEKSRVELDRVTGQTLDRMGIRIDDAESGQVQQLPNVQYVKPNPNAVSTATQDQQQGQQLMQQQQQQQQQQTPQPPK
jgi:hypothetical protein